MRPFLQLARDSLWLLIARIGAQGAMVIVTFLLARRLGNIGLGEYAFIAAAIVIGNTLTTFGTDMFLIREIAARSDYRNLSSILLIQLALSVTFIIVTWTGAAYLPRQTEESVLALKIYSLALIPLAFFTLFTSILRGEQQMASYTWLTLVVSFLQAVAIWLFVPDRTSVVNLASLLLTVQVAVAVLAGIFCYAYIPGLRTGWRSSAQHIFALLTACAPIAGIAILRILYQKLSLVMLTLLAGAAITGWFSAAGRIVEAARTGHGAVFIALFPLMSQASAREESGSAMTFTFPFLALLLLSAAGTILLNIFAIPLVEVFYGAQFQPSLSVLRILSLALIPYTINDFLSISFLAARMERVVVRIIFVSVLLLMLMNYFLIPLTGQLGASWALVMIESFQACLFLFAWKFSPSPELRRASFSL